MEVQVENLTKAYIAGIVDGEGHIALYSRNDRGKVNFYSRVTIANSHLPLLEMIKREVGGGVVNEQGPGMYCLVFGKRADRIALLTTLMPYLIVKKRQAEIVLEYELERAAYKSKGRYVTGFLSGLGQEEWDRRAQLLDEIKQLNGRKTQPYVRKHAKKAEGSAVAKTE
jgi:hypothetical protein